MAPTEKRSASRLRHTPYTRDVYASKILRASSNFCSWRRKSFSSSSRRTMSWRSLSVSARTTSTGVFFRHAFRAAGFAVAVDGRDDSDGFNALIPLLLRVLTTIVDVGLSFGLEVRVGAKAIAP